MKSQKKKSRDRHPPRRNRRVTRKSAHQYCEAIGFAACRAAISTFARLLLAGSNAISAKDTSRVFVVLNDLRTALIGVPVPEYVLHHIGQCQRGIHEANDRAKGSGSRHALRRIFTDANVSLNRGQGEMQLFLRRCGKVERFLRGGSKIQLGGFELSVVIVVVTEAGSTQPDDKSCRTTGHREREQRTSGHRRHRQSFPPRQSLNGTRHRVNPK